MSDFSAEGQTPGTSEGFFSCQEMLFAQLHNLASHLYFNCVSESMDGSPTGFEEEEQDDWLPPGKEDEADWAASTEEPVPKESVSESTHNDFVGFDQRVSSWCDGHWCPAACGGSLSCSTVV